MMDLGEIDQSVGAGVEEVGRLADRHRLPRQVFGLVDATLPGHDLRPDSSPDDLREKVISGGELLADLGEGARRRRRAPARRRASREVRGRRRAERPVAHSPRAPGSPREGAFRRRRDRRPGTRRCRRCPKAEEYRVCPSSSKIALAVGEELSRGLEASRPSRGAPRETGASTPPSSDSPPTSARISSQRRIAFRHRGRPEEERRSRPSVRISLRSSSSPARRACSAACSHASAAAAARAAFQCSSASSRRALQRPCSSSIALEDRERRVSTARAASSVAAVRDAQELQELLLHQRVRVRAFVVGCSGELSGLGEDALRVRIVLWPRVDQRRAELGEQERCASARRRRAAPSLARADRSRQEDRCAQGRGARRTRAAAERARRGVA